MQGGKLGRMEGEEEGRMEGEKEGRREGLWIDNIDAAVVGNLVLIRDANYNVELAGNQLFYLQVYNFKNLHYRMERG